MSIAEIFSISQRSPKGNEATRPPPPWLPGLAVSGAPAPSVYDNPGIRKFRAKPGREEKRWFKGKAGLNIMKIISAESEVEQIADRWQLSSTSGNATR